MPRKEIISQPEPDVASAEIDRLVDETAAYASDRLLLETQPKWRLRFAAFDDAWFVVCVGTIWYSVFTYGGLDDALGYGWFLANCLIWNTLTSVAALIKLPELLKNAKKSLLHPTVKSWIAWSIKIYAALIFPPTLWATWSASRDFFQAPILLELIYSEKTFGDPVPLAMGSFAYSVGLLLFDTVTATYSAIRAYQKRDAFRLLCYFSAKYDQMPEEDRRLSQEKALRFVVCKHMLFANHSKEWASMLGDDAVSRSECVAGNFANIERYLLAVQRHKFRQNTFEAILFFLATLGAAAGGMSMLIYPKIFITLSAAFYTPAALLKLFKLMSPCNVKIEDTKITEFETQTELEFNNNASAFFSKNQLKLIMSGLCPKPNFTNLAVCPK